MPRIKVNRSELDAAFAAWRSTVNMSAAELESWAADPVSRLAADRSPIQRNMRLHRTPKSEWTERDVRDAGRVVAVVRRLRREPQGEPAREPSETYPTGAPSRRDIALRCWGHDPDRRASAVRRASRPRIRCVSSHEQLTASSRIAASRVDDARVGMTKRANDLLVGVGRWIATKAEDEERFVLGIVAEPDEVDTQGDTIQASTIRTAAHKFMADFRNIGLQHQVFVNGKVQILESYVTINDQKINGQVVKAGSWVLGVRVLDDKIWAAVKDGSFTGFSLGGTAVREPLD